MAAMRGGPRVAVGSEAWISEQRTHALDVARQEAEEFSFSARNELEWLNEHMAEIFSENQVHVTELFKTPGKLRGKTPLTATARKINWDGAARAPLSNLFSATPKGAPNPFAIPNLNNAHISKIQIAEDRAETTSPKAASPANQATLPRQEKAPVPVSAVDSGYYGSQSQDTVAFDDYPMDAPSPEDDALDDVQAMDFAASPTRTAAPATQPSPTRVSMEHTFESAKEEQTHYVTATIAAKRHTPSPLPETLPETARATRLQPSPVKSAMFAAQDKSPMKTTTPMTSPVKRAASPPPAQDEAAPSDDAQEDLSETMDDIQSPSDHSSPIRRTVRKSSLTFASLPAREPLTSNKSLGPRASRISHLDQARTSSYQRHTGGKSLGGIAALEARDEHKEDEDEDDDDPMDVDETDHAIRKEKVDAKVAIAAHNKTYTQRLQDQISKLGQSQPTGQRPSKSLASLLPAQQPAVPQQSQPTHPAQSQPQPQNYHQPTQIARTTTPVKEKQPASAPGAFPEDDDDDWIEPPATLRRAAMASPRPALLLKSHTADVMEGVHDKETVGGGEFALAKNRLASPKKAFSIMERTASTPGHSKSVSVPTLPNMAAAAAAYAEAATPRKTISVSNPSLHSVTEDDIPSPPRSPTRSIRESPLKHVKDKLSSIIGKSKNLIASSAALSAEGRSGLPPATTKIGFHPGPSLDSLRSLKQVDSLYPELPSQAPVPPSGPSSPVKSRPTRASIEREKKEAKEREKEEKERHKADKQLEKARRKEAEKARVFSKERDQVADMEKRIAEASQQYKTPRAEAVTPAPPPKSPPRPTRTSPRRVKGQAEAGEDDDLDMVESSSAMPPPQMPRSVAATPAASRGQTLKRPMKPTQVRQEPTVIRVKPGSAQQSQYHPSNRALGDTLGSQQASQRPPVTKPVPPSLKKKTSNPSLTSSVGPSGRPKALDLAAKRREEEEQQSQRRRDLKQATERRKQEDEQRRAEAERQKEEERKQAEKAWKLALIEKAKRTPAPPPAVRPQPNGPPNYGMADKGPSRPPSRLGSMIPQDSSRPVSAMLNKQTGTKRLLPQDVAQPKEKRSRISDEFDQDIDMADSQPRIIKGPPVRPSVGGGLKKELPKSGLHHGYAPTGVSIDIFKKAMPNPAGAANYPLNTAQFSKGQIPGIGPVAGPSQHKTPARQPLPTGHMGKSAQGPPRSIAKSSPFGKQGDDISLPDINSDEEDEDDSYDSTQKDGGNKLMAEWANSPDLRRLLYEQERVDPYDVFGPPAPIVMEEIFAQPRKGQSSRFRARTSSANWSGQDRLTEEECLRDNLARERMMREGKWSNELVRDGLA